MLVSDSMAMISDRDVQGVRGSAWSAYDCLPVGVCIVTASGMILYANPALHGLLACETGGLAGRTLCEFDLDRGLPRAWPVRRADGAARWVTVAETPLPVDTDDAGQGADALRMLTVTDVGALCRQAKGAGAPCGTGPAGMPMVDALLEAVPVPLFVKEADGRYSALGDAFPRPAGIDRPGMTGGNAGRDGAVSEWEGSIRVEAPFCTAEGAMRMASLIRAAFGERAGNPTGIAGAIHEPEETRPQEERLEAILEQSPVGVSVSRRDDGRIIFVNTRFAELIGLPREKLIGSRARDYYLDSHQRLRVLERLRGGGGVTNMEVQFKRADGSPFWTLFTVNQAVIQGVPVNLAWIYDYTERRSMEEALRDMASRDPLTGIYNRRSFMELARSQLARAHRFHEPLSVFVLDVDHFKRINDTFGHATGDDALRMVAAGCQAILREYDLLGRLGGEEFVVVLPGATADESRVVAERVRRHLARMPIEAPDGTFRLTASIGIAGLEGATDTLERAIHRADLALYRAKHLGRNRVAVFEPGM